MPPTKENTMQILKKFGIYNNEEKLEIAHNLNIWRDIKARKLDESSQQIMNNSVLITLLKRLPKNSINVINCYNPVPEIIRK